MQPNRVYLRYPKKASDWADEVDVLLRAEENWKTWDLVHEPYNDRNGFDVQPLFVRVMNKKGPVVLIEPVRSKDAGDLQDKLLTRAVVIRRAAADAVDVWQLVVEARQRHENGEPLLPRSFVVAVLICRKLRKGHYWAGHNDKGYLWSYNLAKGRGVDDRFSDVVDEVVSQLLQNNILIYKTSKGKRKYALNPDRKPEIHAIADHGTFQNRHLQSILMRDPRQESASYLNPPDTAQTFTILSGKQQLHYGGLAGAITCVKGCQDGVQYQAIVEFQVGPELREVFAEHRVLLQFLEAFL